MTPARPPVHPSGYTHLTPGDAATFYGHLDRRWQPMASTAGVRDWERDEAMGTAIDRALADLAAGHPTPPGTKPRWIEGLVRRQLVRASQSFWARLPFPRVRALEALGVVELDADDTYVLAMVCTLGEDPVSVLRADPQLLDSAFWRLFEVEGGGEVSLTNIDRFRGDRWRQAVLELVGDGTLDRGRVLRSCLQALGRDFLPYRASWFSATYLALQPSLDEASALQAQLRRLLSAEVPATQSFAVKQLLVIHKAGRLAVPETLAALRPVALASAKSTALGALRLARAGEASHPREVAAVASVALGSANADVQRAAASLLLRVGGDDALTSGGEALAPSVRRDLGQDAAASEDESGPQPGRGPVPAPVPMESGDVAERASALLENASDAMEFEALLAALAVIPEGDVLAPLRKRARGVLERRAGTQQAVVGRAVLAALGEPTPPSTLDHPAQQFVQGRVDELATGSEPLLATPDLPGGWLSADALARRLAAGQQPRHHDLIAALLRLHPEGRDALAEADLPPNVLAAVLGSEPPAERRRWFGRGPADPSAVLVAAMRSRGPYTREESPLVHAQINTIEWTEGDRPRSRNYVDVEIEVLGTGGGAPDRPTELPRGGVGGWQAPHFGDWVGSMAAIWPHDAEHFLAIAGRSTVEAGTDTEVAHDVPVVMDALAQHPGRMGSLATFALAAVLSSGRRENRLHAVDAALDLLPTGRIPIAGLAATLAVGAPGWPATRWADSFADLAQAPGGGPIVLALLTELLPRLPISHRGVHKLLELLRDESLRRGVRVADPALRTWLAGFSGSSAASRTAARLLVD